MNNNLISLNNDLVEELNHRILGRNNGYGNNEVLLNQRSRPTKYMLPLETIKPICNKSIINYNNNNSHNPNSLNSPWSGFVSNINNESILRNQVYALQKSPNANYVPSSNSELYNSTIFNNNINNTNINNNNINNNNSNSLFPALFKEPNVYSNSSNEINFFNNHTRQQLKDS